VSVGAANPTLREPGPPGPWVDDVRCSRCGALYEDFRGPYDWIDATIQLRSEYANENGSYSEIGHSAWISRGPVLWRLRVAKLSAWYYVHGDPDHTEDPLGDYDQDGDGEWDREELAPLRGMYGMDALELDEDGDGEIDDPDHPAARDDDDEADAWIDEDGQLIDEDGGLLF